MPNDALLPSRAGVPAHGRSQAPLVPGSGGEAGSGGLRVGLQTLCVLEAGVTGKGCSLGHLLWPTRPPCPRAVSPWHSGHAKCQKATPKPRGAGRCRDQAPALGRRSGAAVVGGKASRVLGGAAPRAAVSRSAVSHFPGEESGRPAPLWPQVSSGWPGGVCCTPSPPVAVEAGPGPPFCPFYGASGASPSRRDSFPSARGSFILTHVV